jgi:folate-binding Fe-S cluster repair protein YgfZ
MTPDAHRDLLRRGGVADLAGRTILRFTGADRTRFLNGQVTANVQSLALDRTIPSLCHDSEGQVECGWLCHQHRGCLWFDADSRLRETLPARFERYIIADDVTLEDVSDEMRLVHLLPGEEGFQSMQITGFGALRSFQMRASDGRALISF